MDGKLSILQEAEQEDANSETDERTAKLIRTISDTIAPMVQMTVDYPSNHPSGRMPILDLEVWVEDGVIYHQFYKKPMASRDLVSAITAFSTAKKRSILMEEGLRRLRNCFPGMSWREKVVHLNRFSSDLKRSGHSPSFRKTILRRIIAKYDTDLSNHEEGRKKMYRSRQERTEMKSSRTVFGQRDTWFRSGGFTSTLTVPATPNGLLAEIVRKNLDKGRQPVGTKTKVIEDGGVGASCGIVKSNTFPRDKCERWDCVLCLQKDGEKVGLECDKNNIGYEGKCRRCPTQFAYIGETSRTGYTRLREHLADYRSAARDRLPAQLQQGGVIAGEKPQNVKSWGACAR